MSVAINVENVVKKYDNVTIIPNMTVNINNGEFFTLLGPSGCGKTTLLRMIAGFNSIEGGKIKFDDRIINNISAHKRNIGMVFQNYAIFPHLTVRQNVEYGLKLRKINKEEMKKKVDEILEIVKITDYQERLPERLSGGQQQRICIARALAVQPEILLMDEPTSALDPISTLKIEELMEQLKQKYTVVVVTHNMQQAARVSDDTAFFLVGDLVEFGSTKQMFSYPKDKRTEDYITGRFG